MSPAKSSGSPAKLQPPIGTPPAVQFIATDTLKIDPTYQRAIAARQASQKLIAGIAEKWDWRLCVPLLVAARGPDLYIIDGQHRWAAAKLRGDIVHLPCAVGHYGTPAEEAALFVAANRKRVPVNRLDIYRAALVGGDPETATIDELLKAANLTIADTTIRSAFKPGQLAATAGLYRILRLGSKRVLRDVLAMVGAAFGDQVISQSGVIVAAMAKLNPATMDDDARAKLLAVLRRKTADEWATLPEVMRAKGGDVRATQLFFSIRDLLRERAPAPPTIAPKPAPSPASAPSPAPAAIAPTVWPAWCDQCDHRVSQSVAASCSSVFCKVKRQAA